MNMSSVGATYIFLLFFLLPANIFCSRDDFDDDVDITEVSLSDERNDEEILRSAELSEQAKMERLSRMAAEEEVRKLRFREQSLKKQLQKKVITPPKVIILSPTKPKTKNNLYKVPAWPFWSLGFNQDNILSLDFDVKYAGNAFISGGSSRDLSQLIFGNGDIYVKDILLASQLILDGKVRDFSGNGNVADNYLGRLANQQLHFNGSSTEYDLSLGFARHFLDDHITIGFKVPFVAKKHSLKLTTSANSIVAQSTTFQSRYKDFEDFFVSGILDAKNIAYNNNDTEQGIGDVVLFINANFPSKVYERLSIGLRGQIPTGKKRDTNKLWGVELGNGGFAEISAFGSVLFSENRWFNPHALAEVAYRFHSRLDRRIAERKQFDGSGTGNLSSILALGEYVRGKSGISFDESDSSFKRFATQTVSVSYQKGAEITMQVGNMFKEFLFERAFGDLYYNLRIQTSDHAGNISDSGLFNRALITNDTSELEHTVGFDFSYQFDSYARVRAGVSYPFAGHNIAKTLHGNFSVTVEW